MTTTTYLSYAYSARGDQKNLDAQHTAIETWFNRFSTPTDTWVRVDRYSDTGSSRPALGNALIAMVEQRIQVFAVVSLDRIGRSMQEMAGRLQMAEMQGWAFVEAYRGGLDMTTPVGKLQLQLFLRMFDVQREYEAAWQRERSAAGQGDTRELH